LPGAFERPVHAVWRNALTSASHRLAEFDRRNHVAPHGAPREDASMTPLNKPLRRELEIADRRYTLTIDPVGLKLVQKGHRKGVAITWMDLLNGDAALAAALEASLA
jgi:hypothetical protein